MMVSREEGLDGVLSSPGRVHVGKGDGALTVFRLRLLQ